MPQFMIILIPCTNLLNLSWIKKMSIFEEYGAFNENVLWVLIRSTSAYNEYPQCMISCIQILNKTEEIKKINVHTRMMAVKPARKKTIM